MWFPLLTACRLAKFYASVICLVHILCLHLFLLEIGFRSQSMAFQGQKLKYSVNMLHFCIL